MKQLFPILTFIIGCALGWFICDQRTERKIVEAFPEELQGSFSEVAHLIEPISKEKYQEFLDAVRRADHAFKATVEFQSLWMAVAANRFTKMYEEDGGQVAYEHAKGKLLYFTENYEDGMDLGEWEKIARITYTDIIIRYGE
jgi:hypothetical protein